MFRLDGGVLRFTRPEGEESLPTTLSHPLLVADRATAAAVADHYQAPWVEMQATLPLSPVVTVLCDRLAWKYDGTVGPDGSTESLSDWGCRLKKDAPLALLDRSGGNPPTPQQQTVLSILHLQGNESPLLNFERQMALIETMDMLGQRFMAMDPRNFRCPVVMFSRQFGSTVEMELNLPIDENIDMVALIEEDGAQRVLADVYEIYPQGDRYVLRGRLFKQEEFLQGCAVVPVPHGVTSGVWHKKGCKRTPPLDISLAGLEQNSSTPTLVDT